MEDLNQGVLKEPISEARRYVKNARSTLREHGKLNRETRRYEDPKYVKAAGNYLWLGVLIALDAVFHVKKKNTDRVSVDDYRSVVAKRDIKLLGWMNDGYQIMHLSMNYDGIQDKVICDQGFRVANEIIDRCESLVQG